jgi:hypothetical protein
MQALQKSVWTKAIMEPIEASVANSSANTTDPFDDAATTFIFGNGNTAADTPSTNTTVTPTATAATSQGANSPVQATSAPCQTVVQPSSGGSSSLWIILVLAAVGFFLVRHFLHK